MICRQRLRRRSRQGCALGFLLRSLLRAFCKRRAFVAERPADRADLLHETGERGSQRIGRLPVVDVFAALLAAQQAGMFEQLQMLRDRRLRHVEARRDLAGVELVMRNVSQNLAANGRGQCLEDQLHGHEAILH